jgi:Flp pilus assembly protein TadD
LLEKAIQERPDLGQAYRDMGKLCIQTNQPEAALPYLNKVVELAPEEPSAHYLLAQVYRKLGRQEELKAELALFQKLKQQESDRATKHPDTSGLGGTEPTNERPQEDESPEDLK